MRGVLLREKKVLKTVDRLWISKKMSYSEEKIDFSFFSGTLDRHFSKDNIFSVCRRKPISQKAANELVAMAF